MGRSSPAASKATKSKSATKTSRLCCLPKRPLDWPEWYSSTSKALATCGAKRDHVTHELTTLGASSFSPVLDSLGGMFRVLEHSSQILRLKFPMGISTTFRCAGETHPGLLRTDNEDRFHLDAERGIFLVIDGIGGQAAGERAAQIALER